MPFFTPRSVRSVRSVGGAFAVRSRSVSADTTRGGCLKSVRGAWYSDRPTYTKEQRRKKGTARSSAPNQRNVT